MTSSQMNHECSHTWLNWPYSVDRVLSPEAALEKLANNDYDLLVTDIGMPCLNGEQLHERVAGFHPRRAQRMIFVAGHIMSAWTRHLLH